LRAARWAAKHIGIHEIKTRFDSLMTKLLILLPLFPYWANAQLYTDASANLPNNGARGPSMDVRAADLDKDGDLDLVFAREFQPNVILLNNGTGVFTNAPAGRLPQPARVYLWAKTVAQTSSLH
jgi:hypothetical protein